MLKKVLTFLLIFFYSFLIFAQKSKKEIMTEARQLIENSDYKESEKLILGLAKNGDIEAQYLMSKIKTIESNHYMGSYRRIKNYKKFDRLSGFKESTEWLLKANNHNWLNSKITHDEDSIRIQYVSLRFNPHHDSTSEYILPFTEEQRLSITKLAAEKNIYDSQYGYSHMIRKDSLESLKWLKNAANNDDAVAQEELGMQYEFGIVENIDSALYWFSRAIKLENLDSFLDIGRIYQHGKGVIKDTDKALFYYNSCYELCKRKGKWFHFYTEYPLYRIGEIYMEKGDYKNAIKTYKLFGPDLTGFGFANYKLGEIYAKFEQYNKAIYYLTKSDEPGASKKLKEIRNR